jgi:hypothetical protein
MEVSDEIIPDGQRQIDNQQTFKRMAACLEGKVLETADREDLGRAIDDLKAINSVRNKLHHGGSELAEALNRLGIDYPIKDHGKTWDQVRSKATAALTTIRSALQSA